MLEDARTPVFLGVTDIEWHAFGFGLKEGFSISARGLVTLSHAPLAENFYIWYWYDLSVNGSAFEDYYRDDFVSDHEGDEDTTSDLASDINTNTATFDCLLSSADDDVQKALATLDQPHTSTNLHEPTGFLNRTDSTISFVDLTRVFTIAPTVTSYQYYQEGILNTITTNKTVTVDDTTQLNYIYFNSAGTLTAA